MLISVIIPVYNMQGLMEHGIQTILNQTYSNIQVIIIDDGSTDGSYNEAIEYGKRDSRIEVHRKENGGLADARNFGLKFAKGELIYFFDPDDYTDVHLFESCVKVVEDTNSDVIVFDSVDIESSTGKMIRQVIHGVTPATAGSVAWNKIFKKELWEHLQFPTSVKFEDSGIIPLKIAEAERVTHLNSFLYYYNKNRKGSLLTESGGKSFQDIYLTLKYLSTLSSRYLTYDQARNVFDYIVRKQSASVLEYSDLLRHQNYSMKTQMQEFFMKNIKRAKTSPFRKLYAFTIIKLWQNNRYNAINLLAKRIK